MASKSKFNKFNGKKLKVRISGVREWDDNKGTTQKLKAITLDLKEFVDKFACGSLLEHYRIFNNKTVLDGGAFWVDTTDFGLALIGEMVISGKVTVACEFNRYDDLNAGDDYWSDTVDEAHEDKMFSDTYKMELVA